MDKGQIYQRIFDLRNQSNLGQSGTKSPDKDCVLYLLQRLIKDDRPYLSAPDQKYDGGQTVEVVERIFVVGHPEYYARPYDKVSYGKHPQNTGELDPIYFLEG